MIDIPENEQPWGFAAVGAFFVFGSAMATYAGVTLLIPGTALDRLWILNPVGHARLASLANPAGISFLVLSALLAAAAIGWFRRRRWGWFLGTTIIAINAAGDLANLIAGEHLKGAAGVVIAGLVLIYMTRPRLRSYFT
jgi:hypothetical protein